MRSFIFFCLCLIAGKAYGTDPKYPVATIPEQLKANMNAVFRENASEFTIFARNKASHHVHYAVTIFNAKAKHYATEAIFYDKLCKVRSISATLYDAAGKQVKRLKDRDVEDHSAVGADLFSDDRFKYFDLSQGTYPYTIEVEYEVEYKYLYYIPPFAAVNSENTSCEKAFFDVVYPADLRPRIKLYNVQVDAQELSADNGFLKRSWRFENVLPVKVEPQGPSFFDLNPLITAAPTNFEYENYVGQMTTWDDYGKWIASLNRGRNTLPANTKEKVLQLTKNISSREEKVKVLYQYLQNKTRYVSIQLGIGGYQPFEASVVDQTGYGDCKALSNYMMALLDVAAIKSLYALINAGPAAAAIREDFPSSQFNHVLVAVPNEKDTIWLECTSQTNPFGYQGFHTGDRKALVITDDGAKFVKTKHYSPEENLQSRFAEVFLDATGDGTAKVRTTYSGLQYEAEGASSVLNSEGDEQKKWIQENTRIPTFDLLAYKFEDFKARIPSAVVTMELALRRYCTVSGKRLFLIPNLMNKSMFIPEKLVERKTKIVRNFPYVDIDTVQFHVPENLYPEVLPEALKFTSRFGEYECSYKLDQGSIIYIRKLKVFKGEFPAESYNEYMDFYRKINRADNTKIVLMSKT